MISRYADLSAVAWPLETVRWIALAAVLLAMVSCSVLAVSFSSIFYILLSGAAGLAVYGVQQLRKEAGAK